LSRLTHRSQSSPIFKKVKRQILKTLQTTSAKAEIRVSPLGIRVRAIPNSPELWSVAERFAKEPFTNHAKALLIQQLGVNGLTQPYLLNFVQDALSDASTGIQLASISALRRIGNNAVAPVLNNLVRMSFDQNQDREVR